MSTERFAHFYDELNTNLLPTGSARLAISHELDLDQPLLIELGVSGLAGPQDLQRAIDLIGWQLGIDAHVVVGDLTLTALYLRAFDPGGGVDEAPFLSVDGAYLEANYQLLAWLGFIGRVDARRAVMIAQPNLYISDVARLTVGARFDISFNLVARVEYLRVQELTGPEIPDDVVTSSLVFRF